MEITNLLSNEEYLIFDSSKHYTSPNCLVAFVQDRGIKNKSVAEYYMGISKEKYSLDEINFMATEILKDIIYFPIISPETPFDIKEMYPVYDKLSNLNLSKLSAKIFIKEDKLKIIYDNEIIKIDMHWPSKVISLDEEINKSLLSSYFFQVIGDCFAFIVQQSEY